MPFARQFALAAALVTPVAALANGPSLDAVLETNARIAHAAYEDSLITARRLESRIEAFVQNPSEKTLTAAKAAWLEAREPYGQTEVYRFRGGPIDALRDDGTMGAEGDGPEGRINAWPLGEALIDYTAERVDGDAGPESTETVADIEDSLIADTTFEISVDKLASMNELGGDERNVTTGYHAIEFLLWGQDLNADGKGYGSRDATAGSRPYTDYVTGDGCTHGNCDRRGAYLNAVADLLVADLERVANAWVPGEGGHYQAFVAGGEGSLRKILEGMGRLSYGELAGERILIALAANSQEDEHSCFADNTHRDILLNAKGVQNSYQGAYVRSDGRVVSGPGVADYIRGEHPELAAKLDEALRKTMVDISRLDGVAKAGAPFDVQIQSSEYQPLVRDVIVDLRDQTHHIEMLMAELDLDADLRQDTEENLEQL